MPRASALVIDCQAVCDETLAGVDTGGGGRGQRWCRHAAAVDRLVEIENGVLGKQAGDAEIRCPRADLALQGEVGP